MKLILLGDSNVGKTSLANLLLYNKFNNQVYNTIGAAYNKLTLENNIIDLWDTAGQERFASLVSIYYKNADIIIVMFDLENIDTIRKVNFYLDKLKQELTHEYQLIILGNKSDLLNNYTKMSLERDILNALNLQEETKVNLNINYLSISVKQNINIDILKKLIVNACKLSNLINKNKIKTSLDLEENLSKENLSNLNKNINYCCG
jgi:Ras-related protein Rab-7A